MEKEEILTIVHENVELYGKQTGGSSKNWK
jgi:hypothetical protein